jgi:transposase-like protein/DNA-directed RNA polymerase subunit RPC12/RpoP
MLQTTLSSFSFKKGSLVPWCKRCGAQHFNRKGKNTQGIARYQCRSCGFRFVWTSDLPRRNYFSSIMTFAVELYTSPRVAASLRGVAQIVKKAFNIKVSYESIRQWVLTFRKSVQRRREPLSSLWHVDETYVKIKGVGHWLWVVYCRDTKQVLAWHISQKRLHKEACIVLRQALDNAGCKPSQIITDGLYQYKSAIRVVMQWHYLEQKRRHLVGSGIGPNAFIERLNREIKRRIKWFSTFQSLKGAYAFFGLWFYHHNQIKSRYVT